MDWENFEIFKNENLFHQLKVKIFGRTPLIYILNIYFNPFLDNIDSYDLVFLFFQFLDLIFYFMH